MKRLFATIRGIPLRRWPLLAEAGICLAAAAAAIALLPFARVARMASGGRASRGAPAQTHRVAEIRWAVVVMARRAPFRAKCFEQGLAAHWMLRRRGVASTLFYGASIDATKGLAAHVWVRAGDLDVVGCENASDFATVAQFPADEDAAPFQVS